jgi:hypothetical protein
MSVVEVLILRSVAEMDPLPSQGQSPASRSDGTFVFRAFRHPCVGRDPCERSE